MLNHFGSFWSFWTNLDPLDYLGPFWIILDHFEHLFFTILDHFEYCGPFWIVLQIFWRLCFQFNIAWHWFDFQSIGHLGQCFLRVEMSVCLSVCLSVCVFTFEVPFKRLFAPTSPSQMSNIFRDSESLGKSNGKKWSQNWTFFCWFCLTNMVETTLPDELETSGQRAYR